MILLLICLVFNVDMFIYCILKDCKDKENIVCNYLQVVMCLFNVIMFDDCVCMFYELVGVFDVFVEFDLCIKDMLEYCCLKDLIE